MSFRQFASVKYPQSTKNRHQFPDSGLFLCGSVHLELGTGFPYAKPRHKVGLLYFGGGVG